MGKVWSGILHPFGFRRQAHENIQFQFNADSQYLRDPHSKTLEPDRLSSHTIGYDTASRYREDQRVLKG